MAFNVQSIKQPLHAFQFIRPLLRLSSFCVCESESVVGRKPLSIWQAIAQSKQTFITFLSHSGLVIWTKTCFPTSIFPIYAHPNGLTNLPFAHEMRWSFGNNNNHNSKTLFLPSFRVQRLCKLPPWLVMNVMSTQRRCLRVDLYRFFRHFQL